MSFSRSAATVCSAVPQRVSSGCHSACGSIQTCWPPSFSLTNTTRFLSSFWCSGHSFYWLLNNASYKSAFFFASYWASSKAQSSRSEYIILPPSAVIEPQYLRPAVATAGTTCPTGTLGPAAPECGHKNPGNWPRAPWCTASRSPPLNSLPYGCCPLSALSCY